MAWFEHQHRSHLLAETGGVGLNSDDSKANPSHEEPHSQQISADDGSPLTPELEGFIKRCLVPLLVQSYIEQMKKKAKHGAGATVLQTTPNQEQ